MLLRKVLRSGTPFRITHCHLTCPICVCGSNARKEREKAIFRSARPGRKIGKPIIFSWLNCSLTSYLRPFECADGGSGPSGCRWHSNKSDLPFIFYTLLQRPAGDEKWRAQSAAVILAAQSEKGTSGRVAFILLYIICIRLSRGNAARFALWKYKLGCGDES